MTIADKRKVALAAVIALAFVGTLVAMDYYALVDVLTQRGVMGFL